MPIFVLSENIVFPPAHLADENGLLAVGGDLSLERLLSAYRHGIFPWYGEDEPILWWSPNPRLVLYPHELRVSRRLERLIRTGRFKITRDKAFHDVIAGCAGPRSKDRVGTWIVSDMIAAYTRLYEAGYAHSVEAWQDGQLVGGLYGLLLGRCFFGESMFTRVSNASKVAFVTFVRRLGARGCKLIDCQVTTTHLVRFGAREIPRKLFLKHLQAFGAVNGSDSSLVGD